MNRDETWLDALCGGDRAHPPSIALIAAHPDDEIISAGTLLTRWMHAARKTPGARLTIVHVTNGSPRNPADAARAGFKTGRDYARARRAELLAALELAGISPAQAISLNYVDQEASLDLIALTREISGLLEDLAPEAVITHPYEGGHPDHDAAAFAAQLACRRIWNGPKPAPLLVEMASYHNRDCQIETYQFLHRPGLRERTLSLTERERELKRRMIECFASQTPTLAYFPIGAEKFRVAPDYDFCAPPHAGPLFYELLNLEISGTEWRVLARAALDRLGVASTQ